MKKFTCLIIALLMTNNVRSQNIESNQFTTPTNTGSNMTLGVNTNDLDEFIGTTLGVFNAEGTCVGREIIQDQFFSIAIWGNDTGTPELDGLNDGEGASFAILLADNRVVSIANITNIDGSNFNGYIGNSLSVASSFTISGCTNDAYLEFHTQGYSAEVDNGSCISNIYSLDITPDLFNPLSQTDNSMNVGMNVSSINLFEGGLIGAFFDVDQDGILDCISTTEIQGTNNGSNGFFTCALWGDDSFTEHTDGLLDGQIPTFAILTDSNYVIAFEAVPDFGGYFANGFTTFNEINFDLTVYGCMDAAYCNFNPDAEEDDGSCAGTPGCTLDNYLEYDPDADCQLQGACATTWEEAYNQASSANSTLQAQVAVVAQQAQQMLNQIDSLTNQFALVEASYMTQIANLEDSIANFSSPIAIDILSGWNLIGFTIDEAQDAVASFQEIVSYIQIVKNNAAEVYWPEYSFNGIGDLIPGQGYQIKVTEAIDGFIFPNTNGERIQLSPTVPQWVIDLPVDKHPNDRRTLVKTINLFGQEIQLNNVSKGSIVIHLFSDGTIEKKIH